MSMVQNLPIFQGIFATASLSWLGWLSLAHMETDRTQDVVLERLRQIEHEHTQMHKELSIIPQQTGDRWHASEEVLYQKGQRITDDGQDLRLNRLELFHPPHSTGFLP